MISVELKKLAISNINGFGYCCIVNGTGKNEAIKLLKDTNLTEKSGT